MSHDPCDRQHDLNDDIETYLSLANRTVAFTDSEVTREEAEAGVSNDNDDDPRRESIFLESQTNGARLIYSLSRVPPVESSEVYCKLRRNGLYFAKIARSDEKLRYRENDIRSVIRCVLYGYVFGSWPCESLLELINESPAVPSMTPIDRAEIKPLTLRIACDLLDWLFGVNFARVTRHSLLVVCEEYAHHWRYYAYGGHVKSPTVFDYVLLARFVNPTHDRYSEHILFVNNNTTDYRIPLQNSVKLLF